MSAKYQLSYYDDSTMWTGTWWVNYLSSDVPWIQDVAGNYLLTNNIYLNSKDQTDQAILLISLGLSQEEIQEIINNG